jgi:hypothetical protein
MRPIYFLGYLKLLVAASTFIFVCNADATNWYVRPSAAGSGTGANWANAWSLSTIKWASVAPGDTVWLAGGTYTTVLAPAASGTSGNPIRIMRVQTGDSVAVAAAGWSPSFDAQVNIDPNGGWPVLNIISQHDITIDGRLSSGILLVGPQTGGDNCRVSGTVSNLTISNLELIGSAATSGLSYGRYGFNWAFGAVNNCTINNCYVHQLCNAFRAGSWNGVTVQHCTIANLTLDNVDHNDICYTATNSSSPMNNVIWRYNTISNSPSDGLLFESGSVIKNWYFYGNVCYNSVYALIQTKTPGNYQMFISNNVFGGTAPNTNFAYINLQGTFTGSYIYNNIFYNCENQGTGVGGVTSNYNAYYPATVSGVGWPTSESKSFALSANPFVNAAGGNYHLTASGAPLLANKGIALATDGFINLDMDGNLRGGAAGWYIGAYQYNGAPLPPTRLRITAN